MFFIKFVLIFHYSSWKIGKCAKLYLKKSFIIKSGRRISHFVRNSCNSNKIENSRNYMDSIVLGLWRIQKNRVAIFKMPSWILYRPKWKRPDNGLFRIARKNYFFSLKIGQKMVLTNCYIPSKCITFSFPE